MVDNLKPLWNKIRGLNVPAKVKNLVWRACQNSLPTKTNLVKRKVITDGVCDSHKLQQEDVAHARTIAQNWTVFGTRYHRGIMVSLSKM